MLLQGMPGGVGGRIATRHVRGNRTPGHRSRSSPPSPRPTSIRRSGPRSACIAGRPGVGRRSRTSPAPCGSRVARPSPREGRPSVPSSSGPAGGRLGLRAVLDRRLPEFVGGRAEIFRPSGLGLSDLLSRMIATSCGFALARAAVSSSGKPFSVVRPVNRFCCPVPPQGRRRLVGLERARDVPSEEEGVVDQHEVLGLRVRLALQQLLSLHAQELDGHPVGVGRRIVTGPGVGEADHGGVGPRWRGRGRPSAPRGVPPAP